MIFYGKNFEELSNIQVYEILKSRSEIFMLEQNIHCLDMDNVDYKSRHYFAQDGTRIIAYLRAFYPTEDTSKVKIGRVLTLCHGNGLGKALMCFAIDDIRNNMPCCKILVDAQKQAAGFYEKCGFRVTSGEFLEEGIPHVAMELLVDNVDPLG